MPTKVALRLDSLSCVVESEHGSEPYIWPIMIAEELGIPHMRTPAAQWAAEILANEMSAGQSVLVPAGMDVDLAHEFEDAERSLVVLIVALFEKDSSPRHGSIAVLRHIEEHSLLFVRERLAECRQSSGERNDLRQALIRQLDVGKAERDALSLTDRLTTHLSSGGFDDSIGFTVWTLSGQALATRDISFALDSPSERFTLTGTLQLSIQPTS